MTILIRWMYSVADEVSYNKPNSRQDASKNLPKRPESYGQQITSRESSPESVQGEGIGTELVRLIRQISQVKQRIADGNAEIAKIKESDNYLMFLDAESQGFAEYLKALTTTLDNEIEQARKALDKLLNNASKKLDV